MRTEFSSFASFGSFSTPVQNKPKKLSPLVKLSNSFLSVNDNVNRIVVMSPLLITNHDSFLG